MAFNPLYPRRGRPTGGVKAPNGGGPTGGVTAPPSGGPIGGVTTPSSLEPTPFDKKIARQQARLASGQGRRPKVKRRIQRLKSSRWSWREENRPPALQPWSSRYESTVEGLGRDRDLKLALLRGRETRTRQQYGLDYKPTLASPTDPANPFSLAAALQRNFGRQQARTQSTYASRGQLYAGSLSRAKRADRFGWEASKSALRGRYDTALAGIVGERLGAENIYTTGERTAREDRLEAALNAPIEEVPDKPQYVRDRRKRLRRQIKQAQRKNKHKRVRELKEKLKGL
jgi:hypothetical protein